jgi:DNA-binding NarL/FixJ family response regulator
VSINVVLADDQALVRSGFRMIVEARPDLAVVGEAEDGCAAVELGRRLQPDVILMDVRMPNMDGVEATRTLVCEGCTARILTTYDLDEYVYEAIRAGASGFLLKDVEPSQLEVFKLLARGLSNAELAGCLFLSEATVKSYISHLLRKLGLRDRVQAVVLAYETGLTRPGAG